MISLLDKSATFHWSIECLELEKWEYYDTPEFSAGTGCTITCHHSDVLDGIGLGFWYEKHRLKLKWRLDYRWFGYNLEKLNTMQVIAEGWKQIKTDFIFYTLKIKKGNLEFERGKHGLQPGIYCKCRLNIQYCNNSILVLKVPTYCICRYKGTTSKDGGTRSLNYRL